MLPYGDYSNRGIAFMMAKATKFVLSFRAAFELFTHPRILAAIVAARKENDSIDLREAFENIRKKKSEGMIAKAQF